MASQANLCISYARVSSGKQRREGFGIDRQLERAQEYATQNNLTLDDRLSLQDAGKSGSKGEHIAKGAALYQVLEAAKQGLLGPSPTLLIEDISRLCRLEMMDGLEKIFLPMFRAGVQIVLLEDGSKYDANSINKDQTSMLTLVLKIQAAANYAGKLREYALSHRAKNRKQILDGQPVCAGWAPSWIELHEGEWQFSDKAPAVQRLIELLQQVGTQTASATLNREGHRAPQGGAWTQGSVRRILENPAIYGARRAAKPDHTAKVKQWKEDRAKWESEPHEPDDEPPKKPKREYEVIENIFPALMSRADYDRLIATIKQRATSPRERGRRDQVRFIGQMQTRCICGARIANQIAKRGHLTYGYLLCRGKQLGETDCTRGSMKLSAVQGHILTRLQETDLEGLTQQATLKTKSEHDALIAQELRLRTNKTAADRQLTNARTALKNAIKSGKATTDVFEEAVSDAQAAATEIDEALGAVMVQEQSLRRDGLPEQLQTAVQSLLMSFAEGSDTADQRRAVNQLIQGLDLRITLDSKTRSVGMAIGDGAPEWEPLNRKLDLAAMWHGMAGSKTEQFEPTEELKKLLLAEAERQGCPVVDLGAAVIKLMEDNGEDMSHLPESSRHWFVDTSADQS